ncbi:MAG: glycine cleavage system protein GcvH [Candidatus Cloacimonas sp.]|nr:glycine cleavage system protein GcvH [Candidatus Cloacimonadota bacterium]
MKVKEDLYYSETHEWVKVDGDVAFIGITDYAQNELGDVVYVDLPEEGTEIEAGSEIGSIESAKAVVDLLTPVSGEIIKVNEDVIDNAELVNSSPYEDGWLFKVRLSDPDELDQLMTAGDYKKQFGA